MIIYQINNQNMENIDKKKINFIKIKINHEHLEEISKTTKKLIKILNYFYSKLPLKFF